jgi:hypothetical protein
VTQAERQSIIFGAFAAIRRLAPTRALPDLELHLAAVTAAFNDQIEAAYDRGKADGLIAMESRADRRDLAIISEPSELRLVH